MLNKIFKYLAILLVLPNLNCAAITVFDPQNLAKSVEILKAAGAKDNSIGFLYRLYRFFGRAAIYRP